MENYSSSIQWLSELEMEDQTDFIHQYHHPHQTKSFDYQFTSQEIADVLGADFTSHSFSSDESFSPYMETTVIERPSTQLRSSDSWNSSTNTDYHFHDKPTTIHEASSCPPTNLISFGAATNSVAYPPHYHLNSLFPSNRLASHQSSYMNKNSATKSNQGNKRARSSATNLPVNNQDHVIAERKRREKLSQRLIALSAMIPGLKKMDKASVLGDAVKYLKKLQDQVKELEEQTSKKTMESVVFVKKIHLQEDDEFYSSDLNSSKSLPEIEARVSDKNVLIRIQCEEYKGVLVKILTEIEKFHLTILNSSSTLSGDSVLDITVTTQMDVDFRMTVKDLIKSLLSAFRQFM